MRTTKKNLFAGEKMSKAAFAPCELDFLYLGKDIIATSGGEDAFGTKDEDFDIFGNMTGGEQQ